MTGQKNRTTITCTFLITLIIIICLSSLSFAEEETGSIQAASLSPEVEIDLSTLSVSDPGSAGGYTLTASYLRFTAASSGHTYLVKGQPATAAFYILVDTGTIQPVIILSDVTINNTSRCPFLLQGNADIKLYLSGENTLTCSNNNYAAQPLLAGIGVPAQAAIEIDSVPDADGSLYVSSGEGSAGIGGTYNGSSGSITINGGNITAYGRISAAGIGGGYRGAGTVTINGGHITASGIGLGTTRASVGAGIGGGQYGQGGNITINGGTIIACGTDFTNNGGGAGIGGGGGGGLGSGGHAGTITINGGDITAIGGNAGGAGIGSAAGAAGGSIQINSDAVIRAYSKTSGSRAAFDAASISGTARFVNAFYINGAFSATAETEIDIHGKDWGSMEQTLTVPAGYQCFAYTTGDQSVENNLRVYCSGTLLGTLVYDLTNSRDIISRQDTAVDLQRLRFGKPDPGSISHSQVTHNQAVLTTKDHLVPDEAQYENGYTKYSTDPTLTIADSQNWPLLWPDQDVVITASGLASNSLYYYQSGFTYQGSPYATAPVKLRTLPEITLFSADTDASGRLTLSGTIAASVNSQKIQKVTILYDQTGLFDHTAGTIVLGSDAGSFSDTQFSVTISNLEEGSWYVKAIVSNYTSADNLGGESSAELIQKIEYSDGVIKLNKERDDIRTEEDFVYEITYRKDAGSSTQTFYAVITLPPGQASGTITLTDLKHGLYNIRECDSRWRYQLKAATAVTGQVSVDSQNAAAVTLSVPSRKAEITFKNERTKAEWTGDSISIYNHMAAAE